ncbi:FAD-dependent monooxygenase [Sphingomonas sp. ac-8]|uniref:FAD-dependent monooxygenase n=1 Tax=Sphingomonas sp. ac-8 TaxID=3242977 RepID=UPI003A804998
MAEERCEVLVVGAGPTGLLVALLLRRQGIDVRIVDRAAQPTQESRAFAVSARTLELFASLGLAETMLAQGVIDSAIDFHVSGERVGGLDFDHASAPDTPYRFILMLPQAATEAVLIDALDDAWLAVEREVEVTGFVEEADGMRVDARDAGGDPMTLRAAYVIGADGAHSIVRRTLDLAFEGAKYPQNFLLGDVAVDWPLDHARFRVFVHGDRIGLFFPLDGSGLSRVMTTDLTADPERRDAPELALDELQAAFAGATCLPVTLSRPEWLTRFRTHHRVVDRYRQGRVFVAGDAAHIHSPAGGQGMNTGLHDAANLAWKLVGVLRGGADDALLDSYGAERLPVAQEVLRFTDRIFSAAAGQAGWRAWLRDALAPFVVGPASALDLVQDRAFRKFAQIDIAYPAGAAVADAAKGPGPRPGERAPNAQLTRHRDLFDLLAGYRFHVVALSRRPLSGEDAAAIGAELAALRGERVAAHLIARLAVGVEAAVERVERADVFDRYGLADDAAQALLLVRPDGHIAWRAESLDVAGCAAFLRQLGGG